MKIEIDTAEWGVLLAGVTEYLVKLGMDKYNFAAEGDAARVADTERRIQQVLAVREKIHNA